MTGPVRSGEQPSGPSQVQLRWRQAIAGAFAGMFISLAMAVLAGLNYIVVCRFGTCTDISEFINRATAVIAVTAPVVLGVRGLLRSQRR